MDIAFFWTWNFSANILKSIIKDYKDINIKLIVSQPDKPIWRKKILEPTATKTVALENGIKLLQPEKLRGNSDFFNELKNLKLDFIIVVAYGKIVPKEILEIPKYWCINIHWSILPSYRWASPIQESIKTWDKKTGLTIMYMSEGMDTGDILEIEEVEIWEFEKTQDIFKKFEMIWPKLLIKSLNWVLSWDLLWKKQDDSKATYCSKISKEDWEINFKIEKIEEIYNKFRAYNSWPWIYTYYNWKKLNIEDCIFEKWNFKIDEWLDYWNVLYFQNPKEVWIICKWWVLKLKQLKLEWKKSMNILSFINWNKEFLEYKF